MSKKDYELLARALESVCPDGMASAAARAIADALQADNPRFDRNRFLKACGVLD